MRRLCALITVLGMLAMSGCDPNKEINSYFGKLGLNRLAIVRDDIQPGGLVLSNDKGAMYADNVLDYVTAQPGKVQLPLTSGEQQSNYDAVIASYKGDRSIEASAALKFIQSFIPIDLSNSVSLKTTVNIDLINAKVKRMKIPAMQQFLNSNDGQGFRTAVAGFTADKKSRAFVIYETYETNKLKISSSSGTEITSSINVNEIKIISSAQGKFSLKRNSSSELELSGDKFYVFAVRTGELQVAKDGSVSFKPMNFTPPKDLGIKAAGGDQSYSALVNSDSAPLTLNSTTQQ